MHKLVSAALAVCLLLPGLGLAEAKCYRMLGCTDQDRFSLGDLTSEPDCQYLYEMRNGIYAEHHLCFRTQRAIATFGNDGCVSYDPGAIGLNRVEMNNAATIAQAESALGCPR